MRRPPRWLGYLGLAALLASILLGFALWRLSRDDQRLTAWLTESVYAASGLQLVAEPGTFGFWPRLNVQLEQAELRSADGAVPIKAQRIAVEVPWSSVFGKELLIGRLRIDGVLIDQGALGAWLADIEQLGPPAPLAWPRIDAALELSDVRLIATAGAAPKLSLRSLRLDRWQIGAAARIEAELDIPTLSEQPLHMQFDLTPGQTGGELALEPLAGSIVVGDEPALELRGSLRMQDLAHVDVQLRLITPRLPSWLPTGPAQFDPLPSDLTLRYTGAAGGPSQLKLDGSLAGSALSAALLLPYGFTDQLASGDFSALAEQVGGSLQLERITLGGAVLQGIEWTNPQPTPVEIQPADSAKGAATDPG